MVQDVYICTKKQVVHYGLHRMKLLTTVSILFTRKGKQYSRWLFPKWQMFPWKS